MKIFLKSSVSLVIGYLCFYSISCTSYPFDFQKVIYSHCSSINDKPIWTVQLSTIPINYADSLFYVAWSPRDSSQRVSPTKQISRKSMNKIIKSISLPSNRVYSDSIGPFPYYTFRIAIVQDSCVSSYLFYKNEVIPLIMKHISYIKRHMGLGYIKNNKDACKYLNLLLRQIEQ